MRDLPPEAGHGQGIFISESGGRNRYRQCDRGTGVIRYASRSAGHCALFAGRGDSAEPARGDLGEIAACREAQLRCGGSAVARFSLTFAAPMFAAPAIKAVSRASIK